MTGCAAPLLFAADLAGDAADEPFRSDIGGLLPMALCVHEPVRVEALRSKLPVEDLNEAVIRGLQSPWPTSR